MKRSFAASLFCVVMLISTQPLSAADATHEDVEKIRKEIDALRKRANATPIVESGVQHAIESKYGPNAPVTTKAGKLQIGALLQAWYYGFRHDNRGLFDKAGDSALPDTNEVTDNNSFRVRRTEMYFTMDISENVQAFINWDPAREVLSFPVVTDNQANSSIFKRLNQVAPEFDAANGPKLGSTALVSQMQAGTGAANRTLKDAWINYHGVVPHHDIQVGLFKARLGEEGIRNPGDIDFAERAMGTFVVDDKQRELGALVHGTWWSDRFQYWFGLLDGAGNFYQSAGGGNYNRPDDNDAKDFNYRIMVRPLWNDLHDCWWGKMEIGMSSQMGKHGESAGFDDDGSTINGLNRRENMALFHDGWFYYAFGKKLSGWWVRSEGVWIKDRNAPGQVADLDGNGLKSGGNAQGNPMPFTTTGFFVSTGYKLSDSVFADSCSTWLKSLEFAFRYDTFGNVEVAAVDNPSRTKVYNTTIWSGGINYYIKGHNAKLQMMYNYIRQPQSVLFNFHNVQDNSFIIAWQVKW